MKGSYKINEERLREMAVDQQMTDKQIGIVVGLSRRHVCYLRTLFSISPGSNPKKTPVGKSDAKLTKSPAKHPTIAPLADNEVVVKRLKNRLDNANDAFASAMCGRGHTSLNIPRGPARRDGGAPTQVNTKSSMANFESF